MKAGYAELHCKSNFSFLEGASHPSELVERAAELGYGALAVTDRQSLSGVVRAHAAAKDAGLKLLIGAELHPQDAWPVVVWASDRNGYGRLCRLLTVGRRRAAKGDSTLRLDDLAEHSAGLLAGVSPPPDTDSCLSSVRELARYREIYPQRAYLLAELVRGPDDAGLLERRMSLAARARLPLVAAGDVHYHSPCRQPLHETLTAIRRGCTVAELRAERFANAQRHLRAVDELHELYRSAPETIRRGLEIAQRCTFSLDELRYEYPEELAPAGLLPLAHLAQLTWSGAAARYPQGLPEKVRRLLEHELRLIAELRYEAYFLTVWDLVRFARQRGILCQGRGSAANSAVCYCLGITAVDPEQSDVLFERFVSRERNEAPDIDVDFEHERREEVLQYLYQRYTRERAGLTAVVIRYRVRSAVRDVGKALGLSLDRVDALARQVEGYAEEPRLAERCEQIGLDPKSETGRRLVYLVQELIGFPRHLSQHVGGMVISRGPLCELVPIENAAMPDRTVIQWDKDDLDELGILKVDCLALGMLTALRKCLGLIERHERRSLTLAEIPAADPAVYDMICAADTMGVFQIESRAQMSMLPRLRPRCYYDLVIEVAIVRPGPIQGQMVHPYLRRRAGEEAVSYPNPQIQAVLEKTLGVPIFQEQAMRLAVVAAGFTPGQADQLRRAMGAWRRPGVIDRFHRQLIDGMTERGLSREFADQVFRQIRGFGEYGFPESHAASFALLVYASAWLKHYYPAAYMASILNSQPMGFYAPAQLVRDLRDRGVAVLPVEVNQSDWDCTLQPAPPPAKGWAVRLGLRQLLGLGEGTAETILRARVQGGPFGSVDDFSRRTGLGRAVLRKLAAADAFSSLARSRRQTLWDSLGCSRSGASEPLFAGLSPAAEKTPCPLPPQDFLGEILADYQATGLSLKGHPLQCCRADLDRLRVLRAIALREVESERLVRVAGLVLVRQRPGTAKGITFVTLEDETGTANLVIRQAVWDKYYDVARRSPAWIAHGRLERKGEVIHVLVHRLEDLSASLGRLGSQSRDFR